MLRSLRYRFANSVPAFLREIVPEVVPYSDLISREISVHPCNQDEVDNTEANLSANFLLFFSTMCFSFYDGTSY